MQPGKAEREVAGKRGEQQARQGMLRDEAGAADEPGLMLQKMSMAAV